MAETVAPEMPSPANIAACHWLSEAELSVYTQRVPSNRLSGRAQLYRCRTSGRFEAEQQVFAGRRIEVPCPVLLQGRATGVHFRCQRLGQNAKYGLRPLF
jgi:hypothetical protein